MTTLPKPGHLLTIADYARLAQDDERHWELREGNLVMSPSPTPRHMIAVARLHAQIEAQLPAGLCAVPDVDLDLQLAPPDEPGTVRRPDLVVVTAAEYDRVDAHGGFLRAAATVLVAEVVSRGSVCTDRMIKRHVRRRRHSALLDSRRRRARFAPRVSPYGGPANPEGSRAGSTRSSQNATAGDAPTPRYARR